MQSVSLFSSLFFWPPVALIYITVCLKHLMELSRIPLWKVICLTNVLSYPVTLVMCLSFPFASDTSYFSLFSLYSQSEPRGQSSHPALGMSASNLHVQAMKCSIDCWVWSYLHRYFRQTFLGISCLCLSLDFGLYDFSNSFIEWCQQTYLSYIHF